MRFTPLDPVVGARFWQVETDANELAVAGLNQERVRKWIRHEVVQAHAMHQDDKVQGLVATTALGEALQIIWAQRHQRAHDQQEWLTDLIPYLRLLAESSGCDEIVSRANLGKAKWVERLKGAGFEPRWVEMTLKAEAA